MSSQKIKIGDKEVDKKEFYSSKQAILLDSVDLSKIVVSNKWKINDTTYKYLCGFLNNDVIQPLCVILPQMSGYIKYFDDGGKNMSFFTDDEEIYEKYNEIWEVVKKLLKLKFTIGTSLLIYRMPCHAIGHQVLPTQPLPREAGDFPRGDKCFKHVPTLTYLIYFPPKGYT